ncbi:hypothetical protein EDB83DRAFT_2507870 [Lactarius deliciosus]|nr:hypothetical protein EDB83DRAFT_2507992 [Lactarius deliciosus]KAH9033162.1 hypothetical protein EDB83DRAFT_2507870 [Lactarius deliciosus]
MVLKRRLAHPILPQDLASDIQQFVESEFIQQYFATHRTGFVFKRKVPVGQMMDALPVFCVVRRLIGDSEKGATAGSNIPGPGSKRRVGYLEKGSRMASCAMKAMNQLTNNPNADSTFCGWQLLCMLLVTFPPSKSFERYLQAFLSQHTGMTQGRVDYGYVADRRSSQDAAFDPSTFDELLDARLQIVLLATGLGGTKVRGYLSRIRLLDAVVALEMPLDRGSHTLEGDDPHVPASLLKLWLHQLVDSLVSSEMFNDCIAFAGHAEACCAAIERLPIANRRAVLFVISLLQLFLDELVMAPNLLRCRSESCLTMPSVVHNLPLHLEIDPQHVLQHGLGIIPSAALGASKSRNRRAHSRPLYRYPVLSMTRGLVSKNGGIHQQVPLSHDAGLPV